MSALPVGRYDEETPPCGGSECGYTMLLGHRVERHVLDVREACREHTTPHETCTLHGGVHYRHRILHGVKG